MKLTHLSVLISIIAPFTVADAATDAEDELEHIISPEEMAKIKKEAERLKSGKADKKDKANEKSENQQGANEEEMKSRERGKEDGEQKETRQRSIRKRQTLEQGINPSKQITQKPAESLGVERPGGLRDTQ